jgi:hypothetical protein
VKKILILVFILVILTTTATAEAIDLSVMSLDELVVLHNVITAEINARTNSADSILGSGTYVVGKAVKPGFYEFVCLGTPNFCEIQIYHSVEEYDANKSDSYIDMDIGSIATLVLEDGMVFSVMFGYGTFREINPSWAP